MLAANRALNGKSANGTTTTAADLTVEGSEKKTGEVGSWGIRVYVGNIRLHGFSPSFRLGLSFCCTFPCPRLSSEYNGAPLVTIYLHYGKYRNWCV